MGHWASRSSRFAKSSIGRSRYSPMGCARFDKSGEYKADGALSLTAWLRWKCRLSGGAAMERVEIARHLEKLPKTGAAFAKGDVGYQHVAVLARTAEHLGAAAARHEEASLPQAA